MFSIASKLLDHILSRAQENEHIHEVFLHVQISNLDAKAFYEKHGFKDDGIINDYYKKIDPPHCYILKKNLR